MTLKYSDLGNIVSPPGQVSSLHSKIVTELRAAAGNSFQQSAEAPALVTSVNTSRVVADIKRDLSRVTGQTLQFPVRNDNKCGGGVVLSNHRNFQLTLSIYCCQV